MRYNILGKFCVVTQEKAWVVKNPINTWYDETRISTVQQRAMEVNFLKTKWIQLKLISLRISEQRYLSIILKVRDHFQISLILSKFMRI